MVWVTLLNVDTIVLLKTKLLLKPLMFFIVRIKNYKRSINQYELAVLPLDVYFDSSITGMC